MSESYETVYYKDLMQPSWGCERSGGILRDHVDAWKNGNMGCGGPLTLLDTEDYESWEMLAPIVHEARKVKVFHEIYDCPECGQEHHRIDPDEHPDDMECCENEEGEPIPLVHRRLEPSTRRYWGVYNTDTCEWVTEPGRHLSLRLTPDLEGRTTDGEDLFCWEDEDEAREAARHFDEEYESNSGYERRYGFPWANNSFWLPDAFIADEDLLAAGFAVATFKGHRLCGIDGGGYSFEDHFVALCLLHSARNDRIVPVKGRDGMATWVKVSTDPRSDMQQLADVAEEVA